MKVKKLLETPYEGDELTRAARQKIDYDISELKCRIQSLRTKRNELSPISVLPPEVLSSIFILVRDSCPETLPRSSRHPVSWIYVGHICRHWREIALNCPRLWSIPVFTRPNLAQEMMQRSGMAPLTIRSTTDYLSLKALEQLEKGLAQTTRIRSIELGLEGHPRRRFEGIFSILSQPTPLLENLYLAGDDDVPIPLDTLSNAPRLRTIYFHSLNFSWESAVFKHTALTDLRITYSPGSTMGQMMNTLHHLPNLRTLILEYSIPPYTASDGNIRTVDFKFLERLVIEAHEAADCCFFLRHIQYPSSTIVKLRSYETSAEDSTATTSLLGENLCRVQNIGAGFHQSPVVIRSARLTSTLCGFGITLFNRTDNINNKLDETGGPDPLLEMYLNNISHYTLDYSLTTVTNSFDLSSLEEVLFDLRLTSTHICVLQDSFGKLPNLKVIKISLSRSLPEICTALAGTSSGEKSKSSPTHDPPQGQETSQHPLPVFPALETLIVQTADFSQRQHLEHPEILDFLMDMLIQRSNVNMPINNLSLEQCRGVRTWQIRLLGELVVHLEVDGKVVNVRELGSNGWSVGEDYLRDEYEEDGSDY